MKLYKNLAKYYDLIFEQDYDKEAKIVSRLLKKKGTLLDVGCGTGDHMNAFNKQGFTVEGLDSSKEMLTVAKKKYPKAIFHKGKMQRINLDKEYDVITLLNRTLLFVKNKRELKKVLKRIRGHLKPKGMLVMDLDLHEEYFDTDKSETNYFTEEGVEGSVTEEYDLRGDKILWSVNLSISEKDKVIRVLDNQEYLLVDVKKLIILMKEIGFKTKVYTMHGKETKSYKKPIILIGEKLIKKA